jgi:hypothetical protein
MGFFDQAPRLEVRATARRRPRTPWEQPDAAVPASLHLDPIILARTDDAAVAATRWQAYPTGLTFTMQAHLRHERIDPDLTDAWHHAPRGEPGEALPDGLLRVGIQYSDGRACSNLAYFPGDTAHGPRPMLMRAGSQGSYRRLESDFWLWPQPPAGPLTLLVMWPLYAIAETVVHIDGEAIADAVARSVQLWPELGETSHPAAVLRLPDK